MEQGASGSHGRDKLRTPDRAGTARNGEFVGEARVHVHGVGHEGEGGKLIGELTTEEKEVGERGVGLLKVVEDDSGRDESVLDGGEGFQFQCLVREFL